VHVQELEALQQGMRHLQERVGQQDGVIKQHERRLLEVVQVRIKPRAILDIITDRLGSPSPVCMLGFQYCTSSSSSTCAPR
jgi:hypothetical protein